MTEGLTHGRVLLSGPQDDRVLPADLYRRLSTDLGANGCKVAADLAGERLEAVLAGHPSLIKVSHEELLDDGRAKSDDAKDLVAAMRTLREDGGACTIVVSRAGAAPALALFDDDELGEAAVVEVVMPKLEPADPAGAGDSMTAGMVAALARGRPLRKALQIGAACGALNVVRHGLGTGGARAVETLADRVELRPWK
ncbi:PfkB family carbohydrate kinase [Mycolicibacterium smegmatis]|uniref:PfkB family carbohydrate kinase n=1 Tax=Mycolicibacterium smegmatis TaxID=1772 RepID=UPI0003133873|nr:PfkB family carbohydrate kinase [Mycolicibacterium smegmatis]